MATENRDKTGTSTEPGTAESWQYYYPDYIGSNSVVARKLTDPNNPEVTVQKSYFRPFGEFSQSGAGLSSYLFTDQENDPESGLMYFNARYYDPWVGRFLSQDPDLIEAAAGTSFAQISDDPINFNSYTYARNAPTVYTDPTGRCYRAGISCGITTNYGFGTTTTTTTVTGSLAKGGGGLTITRTTETTRSGRGGGRGRSKSAANEATGSSASAVGGTSTVGAGGIGETAAAFAQGELLDASGGIMGTLTGIVTGVGKVLGGALSANGRMIVEGLMDLGADVLPKN